jgi:hypothetical protein
VIAQGYSSFLLVGAGGGEQRRELGVRQQCMESRTNPDERFSWQRNRLILRALLRIVIAVVDEEICWPEQVDGVMDFGCDGATPGTPGRPVNGWNAGPGTENAQQWLVFDFKQPTTLSALRYTGGGDTIHDADEMTISVGSSAQGPWKQIGPAFHGKPGDGKANT